MKLPGGVGPPVEIENGGRNRRLQYVRVARQRLSGRARREKLDKRPEFGAARDDLLDPDNRDMDRGERRRQADIPLALHKEERPLFGGYEIGAAYPDVGGEKFLPQYITGKLRQLFAGVERPVGPEMRLEELRNPFSAPVNRRGDNVRRLLF